MGKEEFQHAQQFVTVPGNSAETRQTKKKFLTLGRLQCLDGVLIEPGIDTAENDACESIGWRFDVVRRLRICHLRRIWETGDRRFGQPVADPAATADQRSPQRIKAGPRAWERGSKPGKRVIGRGDRKGMPLPG